MNFLSHSRQAIGFTLLLVFGLLVVEYSLPSANAQFVPVQANSANAEVNHAFRIDTDIYSDPKKAPIKHTLTVFSDSVYYDYEDGDLGRVTVIDPKRNRIVLLDRQRQVQSSLSTDEVQLTIANARVQADAKLSASTLKEFQKQPDGESVAVVSNDSIEYRSTLQAPTASSMAIQYAEFANWSARLNSIYAPIPPYLRLDLNELIVSKGMLPKELTRISRKGLRQGQLVCRLRVIDRLSEDDRSRVARVGAMMAEFRQVPIDQYWNATAVVHASATETR